MVDSVMKSGEKAGTYDNNAEPYPAKCDLSNQPEQNGMTYC